MLNKKLFYQIEKILVGGNPSVVALCISNHSTSLLSYHPVSNKIPLPSALVCVCCKQIEKININKYLLSVFWTLLFLYVTIYQLLICLAIKLYGKLNTLYSPFRLNTAFLNYYRIINVII